MLLDRLVLRQAELLVELATAVLVALEDALRVARDVGGHRSRDHHHAVAADVARYAKRILDGDKEGRRKLYEKLGLPKDKSVQ